MQEFNITEFRSIVAAAYAGISVEVELTGDSIVLRTDEESKSLVIGKKGRNINSLRELVKVYNKLYATNYTLELEE